MSEPCNTNLGDLGPLPLELRNMVYDEVFGPTKVIMPMRCSRTALSGDQLLQPEVYVRTPVQTSILSTSKAIYKEAFNMLYRDRTVRGDIVQLLALLRNATFGRFKNLVRRIEVDDELLVFQNHPFTKILFAPRLLQLLPQIRSITILSDKFAFTPHNGRFYITVREFATMMHLGEAICVSIGRFQLRGKFSHIQIVHRKLVKMWPNVASTPEDYDVYADVLGLPTLDCGHLLPFNNNVPAWAAQTSLRRWVGLCNEWLRVTFDLDSHLMGKTKQQQTLLRRFLDSTRGLEHLHPGSSLPSYAGYIYESRIRRKLVHMLRPGDSPEMLAWATDLLSINIAAYRSVQVFGRGAHLRQSHWAEADGGMHTLDIMMMHILAARRGDVDEIYVAHPAFPKVLELTATVKSLLTFVPPQILQCEAGNSICCY